MIAVYREYEAAAFARGSLDFADLLLCTLELLRERPDILHHYQERFRAYPGRRVPGHQRHPVRLAASAGRQRQPSVRGRRRRSVHLRLARGQGREHPVFQRDYPTTRTIRLEQNYRSTGTILKPPPMR
jgi:DNA helicase II / ATP-dependent DNA helicase PcrA